MTKPSKNMPENEQNADNQQEASSGLDDALVASTEAQSDDLSEGGLEGKFSELEAKAAENWDKALRAMSDLENFRKRAERDISNAHKYALENMIMALLPVVDNLERAIGSLEETASDSADIEGIQMTEKMFVEVLSKFSVTQIDPLGQSFDPNYHEAMTMQAEPGAAPGTVLMVFQKGYTLHDRVIRPAKVAVAKENP